MNLITSAHSSLVALASGTGGGAEHGGEHASLNPFLTGGGALLALLLLLWITTRFNRDR